MIITVWEVYSTGTDGQSWGGSIGFFSSEALAKAACPSWERKYRARKAIKVDGKIYRLASNKPIKLDQSQKDKDRERALAKLTPKDRKALGIK